MNKTKFTKLWLVLAAVVILVTVLVIPAMATEVDTNTVTPETPDRLSAAPVAPERFAGTRVSTEQLSRYVDVDDFIEEVLAQAASCPDKVNITNFNIPSTDALMQEIRELIWYRTPLAFHMYSLGFDYNSSYKLTYITVDYYPYADTVSEYTTCYNKFMSGANKLLSGVVGNNNLTDVQKALLLHDRLVQWVTYDWENYNKYGANLDLMPDTDFTAYGVFGERVAVCQGYAMAYMYMLDQVGIENDYVDSTTLCHAWNIVYINGKPYHVDATWDDPDMLGMVEHDNFLLSSTGLWNTGHEAYDYNTSPVDTTYEDYLWANCDAEFQLIGNRLYFLDYYNQEIRYWNAGSTNKTTSLLRSADDGWTNGYGNYSVLGTKGDNLIYSAPNKIYLVTSGGGRSTLYTPTLYSNEYIYGFTYEDGVLKLLISTSPDIGNITTERYLTVTLESTQYTVTFKNWDETVISTKTYSKGATLQVPANPTRPDGVNYTYTFAGWDPALQMTVNADAVYTATYTKTLKPSYTIIFKDWDGTIIKETKYREGATISKPANPTRPADSNFTYKFAGWTPTFQSVATADAVYTATYTATPLTVKAGWNEIGGKWYYYNDNGVMQKNRWLLYSNKWYWLGSDGVMAVNCWRQDSKGWVYLGKDGYMLTNAWCTDSQGWCYVGADGYAVTNCWKQDSYGWIYLNSQGSMTKNSWILSGGKWYFLDANGYMVTSQWRKDSKGWCWLTSSGAMATNQWVKDSKGWCYVGADGYCWTNRWAKDSYGWIYLDSEGSMSYNTIVYESSTEVYCTGDDGYMVTNTWVWDLDYYKYRFMGSDGKALFNTSRYIDGVWRYFDSNGFCTNAY